jgi:hypothetical protein
MVKRVFQPFLLFLSILLAGWLALESYNACRLQQAGLKQRLAQTSGTEPVSVADQFWNPVRRLLANAPVVGFVSSRPARWQPGDMVTYDDHNDGLAFTRLQYALAPSVVVPGTDAPWVVARFDTQEELNRFLAAGQYSLLTNPAPGRALLKVRANP